MCLGPVCFLGHRGLQVGGASSSGLGGVGRVLLTPIPDPVTPSQWSWTLSVLAHPWVDPGLLGYCSLYMGFSFPCSLSEAWPAPLMASYLLVQPHLFSVVMTSGQGATGAMS